MKCECDYKRYRGNSSQKCSQKNCHCTCGELMCMCECHKSEWSPSYAELRKNQKMGV